MGNKPHKTPSEHWSSQLANGNKKKKVVITFYNPSTTQNAT